MSLSEHFMSFEFSDEVSIMSLCPLGFKENEFAALSLWTGINNAC
jgi:hypothetical protein